MKSPKYRADDGIYCMLTSTQRDLLRNLEITLIAIKEEHKNVIGSGQHAKTTGASLAICSDDVITKNRI